MMPGADDPVSAAGGACGSVSEQRRPAEKKHPSTTAATTVNSLFIQPISLRLVPLYSDPTDWARELPCRVARPTQKDVPCLVPFRGRTEKDLWTARQDHADHEDQALPTLGANRRSPALFLRCPLLAHGG
jgi:hypothetical protein